jgi:hypothetical protein
MIAMRNSADLRGSLTDNLSRAGPVIYRLYGAVVSPEPHASPVFEAVPAAPILRLLGLFCLDINCDREGLVSR